MPAAVAALLTVLPAIGFYPGGTSIAATAVTAGEAKLAGSSLSSTRSFYMGFTTTEFDATSQALDQTYEFIAGHGDLVAHHLPAGIPWPEAYDQKHYHPAVEHDLQSRVAKRRIDQKVLISVSPIAVQADDLAGYWAERPNMPRPQPWSQRDFDDPQVITAYTNFVSDLVRRVRPDFLAYGVEVNQLIKEAPAKWPKFVRLAKVVHSALKAEYPKLPVFVSLQADDFWANPEKQGRAIKEILPYTDYVAVSAFPYLGRSPDPRAIRKNYLSGIAALAPGKPFLVAGTGFPAKDVMMLGTRVPGREDWQDAYMRILLTDSQRLHAKAVVWFVPRDYDALMERLKALHAPRQTLDLYAAWQPDGLVDAKGTPRKALLTWMDWWRRLRRD